MVARVLAARGTNAPLPLLFLLGGAFNAATCVILSHACYLLLEDPVAGFVGGYAVSLTISYVVNALLVFRVGTVSVRGYLGFCLSYLPNFLVQFGLVAALTRWLGVPPLAAYLVGVAIAVPLTFVILDRVTFGAREGRADRGSRP